MNDVHFSSLSNEWQTPSFLFKALDKEFKFKLDAASTKDNALCSNFFTKEDNALEKDWHEYETIWCNPPYGRDIGRFIKKAYMESQKGCTVVLLIPARVDTRWWHDYCSKCEVRFIKGRLKFINKSFPSYKADGDFKVSPAPFPSAIVVMNNKEAITKYVTQEF
jgi:site-specific DNA-methyltransferase (adenine-specific)